MTGGTMSRQSDKDTADFSDDDLIRGAYAIEDQDDAKAFYSLWADDYDDHMVEKLGYVSPSIVADLLFSHLDGDPGAVLDVGCGTGLTGQALAERGAQTIDGIDLSAEMLEKAASRGIYRHLSQADLTRPLAIRDGCYNALVSSGTFTHGHVGPEDARGHRRPERPQLGHRVGQALGVSIEGAPGDEHVGSRCGGTGDRGRGDPAVHLDVDAQMALDAGDRVDGDALTHGGILLNGRPRGRRGLHAAAPGSGG